MGITCDDDQVFYDTDSSTDVTVCLFGRHFENAGINDKSPSFSLADAAVLKTKTATLVQFGTAVQAISPALSAWWLSLPQARRDGIRRTYSRIP